MLSWISSCAPGLVRSDKYQESVKADYDAKKQACEAGWFTGWGLGSFICFQLFCLWRQHVQNFKKLWMMTRLGFSSCDFLHFCTHLAFGNPSYVSYVQFLSGRLFAP